MGLVAGQDAYCCCCSDGEMAKGTMTVCVGRGRYSRRGLVVGQIEVDVTGLGSEKIYIYQFCRGMSWINFKQELNIHIIFMLKYTFLLQTLMSL